ncbi:DUF2243 domain-containing protein [Sphingomonas montana]|uniref:DUF2243 domain-containing protein n=1 Tax=Sphingomonas montana TaxID=1843236 RepID=UPI00096D3C0B|nr:DUF2243 domain-containing protein [Sphingomonas montana]
MSGTRPIVTAGMVIGIGMGGFADGILFHQILQIHNMLSARVSTDTLLGTKVNMVWDGLFHIGVWTTTAIGIAMLWRAAKRVDTITSGRALVGSLLMGWGLFNLVEGIIDHHILNLHHVYERAGQSVWDWLFLAFGVALVAAGRLMMTAERNGSSRLPRGH